MAQNSALGEVLASGMRTLHNNPRCDEQELRASIEAKLVKVPVILTGGVTEAEAAAALLEAGAADLIGVGRAIAADFRWARKALEAQRQRPR